MSIGHIENHSTNKFENTFARVSCYAEKRKGVNWYDTWSAGNCCRGNTISRRIIWSQACLGTFDLGLSYNPNHLYYNSLEFGWLRCLLCLYLWFCIEIIWACCQCFSLLRMLWFCFALIMCWTFFKNQCLLYNFKDFHNSSHNSLKDASSLEEHRPCRRLVVWFYYTLTWIIQWYCWFF